MLDFIFPKYNEKELYLNNNDELLSDTLILGFTEWIIRMERTKLSEDYDKKDIYKIKIELIPIIQTHLKVSSKIKIDRIKVVYRYKFFTNYHNLKIIFNYLLLDLNHYKKSQEWIENIIKNIDLEIYKQIYNIGKKQCKKIKLKDVISFFNSDICENKCLQHYKENIIEKPDNLYKSFIIIFSIYIVIIISLFLLFIKYEKIILKQSK
jgi:hypothetical protein